MLPFDFTFVVAFKSANKSFMFANDFKLPLRASFIAAMVVASGTNGSNGKAFSCAMRVSMIWCIRNSQPHGRKNGTGFLLDVIVNSGAYNCIGYC